MTFGDPQANQGNHSNSLLDSLDTSVPLFDICWNRQSCSSCLAGDVPCSWCATVGKSISVVFSLRIHVIYKLPELWLSYIFVGILLLFGALHSLLTLFRIPIPLHSHAISTLPTPSSRACGDLDLSMHRTRSPHCMTARATAKLTPN